MACRLRARMLFESQIEGTLMKCKGLWVVLFTLLLASVSAFAQSETAPALPSQVLQNKDVLRMYLEGQEPGAIISRIVTSPCNFDIFPPVLRELRMRDVPQPVLMAMSMVPYGPPAALTVSNTETVRETTRIEIPAGTRISVVTARPVSSATLTNGSPINFLVSRPVVVNGLLVIKRGALARARVVKAKHAGSWGRAGAIDFAMEDVEAVDGTRVPAKLADGVKGANRSAAVTVAAIITGAIVLPYTPPAALIWGLKKGNEAVLDQSTKFTAIVRNGHEVAGLQPEKKKVIYHSVEALKKGVASTGGLKADRKGFRPTSIRQR